MSNFIFWGLFVALGLVVGGYAAWLIWVEREERRANNDEDLRS